MSETGSLITDGLREAISVASEPLAHEVERGAIVRFADAIADPNPLYRDEAHARHSGYEGIIAPPTFLRTLQPGPPKAQWQSPLHNRLDGGSEWQYLEPVHAGDRITVVEALVEVKQRTGRLGPMVILTRELTYTNQLDQLVATQRWTLITY